MSPEDEAAAVLAQLRADPRTPSLIVHDGKVPTGGRPPYVLVYLRIWTPSGVVEPQKVGKEATSDIVDLMAYCHSVGVDAEAARSVASRVRYQLRGYTPLIPGRVCTPIWHEDAQPPQRDESLGTAVFDQVDVWRFQSLPG